MGFERLSTIKPVSGSRFDLDRLTADPRRRELAELIDVIKDAKEEFRRDGAAHTWSTYKIIRGNGDRIIDATMNDTIARNIIGYLDHRRYFVQIKFIVGVVDENGDETWIIRDKLDPVLADRKTVLLSKDSKPGVLVGIDIPYYVRAYPVTAVVYGIYPMKKPSVDKLNPMRVSTLNCVAERVMEHFKNAARGNGLTALRQTKITTWANRVANKGASINDVAELERLLKFPITVASLTGEQLYKSKYNSRGSSITIIDHNSHAWAESVTVFPRDRVVKYYPGNASISGNMFDCIYEISKTDPVSVWLFRSDEEGVYDQFVRPSGEIYRTEQLHNEMKKLAEKYRVTNADELLTNCFTVPGVAAHVARERNSWRPTPKSFLADIQQSCVEYGHGGLWNTRYDYRDMISVDMAACYPGSFLGYGECSEYFTRFGHVTNSMTRVAVNGVLPDFDLTGFACVTSFEFAKDLHPVCYVWFGRHFVERRWVPIVLLRYMLDSRILVSLTVSEAIICYHRQTEVWLPTPIPITLEEVIEDWSRECPETPIDNITKFAPEILEVRLKNNESAAKDLGRRIIGKFTQGGAYDHKRHHSRLIMDKTELELVIADAATNNTFCNREDVFLSDGKKLGTVFSYIDGESSQYTHLRSSMLAYVSINLLSMINRFPDVALRVATDSFYINRKHSALLDSVIMKSADAQSEESQSWGSWRIKNEMLHGYCESADVTIKDEYRKSTNNNFVVAEMSSTVSLLPSVYDPVTRHKTVYLNGPGGSGKTTRVIELFRNSDMITLTPTHRLAREMRQRNVNSCTYHSFFKYNGGTWTPERMGQKYIPEKIIWDEIDTVPLDTLKQFLDWLLKKNTAVIMCGDHGQPPPFTGESPHEWLKTFVDYYEEITDDVRALDATLKEFKTLIRLQPNSVQCEIMREMISETSMNDFWETWKPSDLIVASRKIVRDTLQQRLFQRHREIFPTLPVPLCYRPADTRLQNIDVDIPGTLAEPRKQNLVLNDIVLVDIDAVERALSMNKSPWTLGYAMTIHSSQGLTISDTIVWIVDDRIEWSNLVYLAVSRVRRMSQLRRIVLDDVVINRSIADDTIRKKLAGYKQSDKKNNREFDLDADFIAALRQQQNNHCAGCNCIMLWQYSKNNPRQFTVDRKDSSLGHTRENVILTCLECNRNRGAAASPK